MNLTSIHRIHLSPLPVMVCRFLRFHMEVLLFSPSIRFASMDGFLLRICLRGDDLKH